MKVLLKELSYSRQFKIKNQSQMNIQYLKKIELGRKNVNEFIVKAITNKLGTLDHSYGFKKTFQVIEVDISFPKNVSGYTYENFLDDFDDVLLERGHIYSEKLVVALTLVFLLIRRKEKSTLDAWRRFIFNFFTTSRLHLEFPTELVLSQVEPPIKLKNYEIGAFDFGTMKDKISNFTQSDFAIRLEKDKKFELIKNNKYLSFKRIENKCSTLNMVKLIGEKYFPANSYKAFVDIYFEELSAAWFEIFWNELELEQTVSVALGGIYYDLTWLRELNIGKGLQIAIFTHIGGDTKQGWVIPGDPRPLLISLDSKTRPEELNNKIKDYYESLDNTETPFINLIKVLTEFIAQGNKLLFQNKVNEAFLNFWIGLDAVLNDDDKLAQSKLLKKRVALLSFLKNGKDFSDQFNYIEELYSLRSSLVHAGEPVARFRTNEICNIAEIVLENLFCIHINAKTNDKITIESWFKDVDDLTHLLVGNAKPEKTKPLIKKLGLKSL